MTRKLIALLCICTLMLSCSVYAASYSYGFPDYLPDEWSDVTDSGSADAVAAGKIGIKSYAAEKMVYLEKTADTAGAVSATKTFDGASGNMEIWLTYSVTGEGKADIEFLNSKNEPVLKFAATKDSFYYTENGESEESAIGGLEEGARHTLKVTSAGFPTAAVMLQGIGNDTPFIQKLGTDNVDKENTVNKVKISTQDKGTSVSIYHLSVNADTVFFWDDIQSEDELAKWTLNAKKGYTADIRETGEGGFLSYYRAEEGVQGRMLWQAGEANRALGFKMTMRYSIISNTDSAETMATVQPRLLRDDGKNWLTQLQLNEGKIAYTEEEKADQGDFIAAEYDGFKGSDINTLTIYSNYPDEDTYDMYLNGVLLKKGINQSYPGDVGLGAILFLSDLANKERFAMRIYTLDIADDYERKLMDVSEGTFKDEYGNELTQLQDGTITGEYTVSSDGLGESGGMLMMMQYEGDKLVNISATPVTALVNEKMVVSGELDVSDVTENTKLYMCLWDGLETIVPLTDTMSVLD